MSNHSDGPVWWSQPMRPEGDNTGSGIKNQLGRPKLGEFAILIREAVQNSWDARLNGSDVRVKFELSRLGKKAIIWRELFGESDIPGEEGALLGELNSDSVVLTISDRGTAGLGGAIRSDMSDADSENNNFVQFIRNVGEARDTKLGGGTYGFGKGIYYRVSRCSAILVDSRSNDKNSLDRRLMGAALSDTFADLTGQRFTGRHWWGSVNDGVPDPVIGDEAEKLATALGLPGFEEGETGTDIVVLLPDITLENPDEDLFSLGERLRAHIYWNLWSKFKTSQRFRGITFSVCVEGEPLEMPEISKIPILQNFANSLDAISSAQGEKFEMKKHRPNFIGEFASDFVISGGAKQGNEMAKSIQKYAPFVHPYRHVARMRQAELIVDYVQGPEFPTPEIGYVGVFRASAYADDFFARAEPPTHDDWSMAGLTKESLGAVRQAKSWLTEQCQSLVNARSGVKSKMVQGLGRLSNDLGTFVTSASGSRAEMPDKIVTRSSRGARTKDFPAYSVLEASSVRLFKGHPVVEVELQINGEASTPKILEAGAYVVLANGRREQPNSAPMGVPGAEFLGWFFEDQSEPRVTVSTLRTDECETGRWSARFSHLNDAALRVVIESVKDV